MNACKTGATRTFADRWQATWSCFGGAAMEIWEASGVGCYLCWHLCTIIYIRRSLAVCAAGDVAARMESLKEEKYADLLQSYNFVPVAVETSGVFGPQTLSFVWGNWGGGLGTRREKWDQLPTWSNACQWLSSEAMQFLFWGPAAAKTEPPVIVCFFFVVVVSNSVWFVLVINQLECIQYMGL